jgi:hypothetical protein
MFSNEAFMLLRHGRVDDGGEEDDEDDDEEDDVAGVWVEMAPT